jgi:hypothetical protein
MFYVLGINRLSMCGLELGISISPEPVTESPSHPAKMGGVLGFVLGITANAKDKAAEHHVVVHIRQGRWGELQLRFSGTSELNKK